jgi:hypothetical protein
MKQRNSILRRWPCKCRIKIITTTVGILQIKLRDGEYEVRKPLDEIIYSDLIEAIKLSENLSERFKRELLDFIG